MKFATVLFLVAASLAALLELTTSKTAQFEKEPKEALRQLLDEQLSLDDSDHLRQLTRRYNYKRTTTLPPSAKPTPCELDYCKIPEDRKVTVLQNKKSMSFNLKDFANIYDTYDCQPKKMFVRLQMFDAFSTPFPTYVSLHRCIGHAYDAIDHHCHVKEKEVIKITYFDLTTNQYKMTNMFNHTKCGYQCSLRQEDCKATQTLMNSCYCHCTLTASQCNKDQYLDTNDCDCKCKPLQSCSNKLMQRNKDCKCECDPRIKNICVDHGLKLNPLHCACM